jgi:hypothetical protein
MLFTAAAVHAQGFDKNRSTGTDEKFCSGAHTARLPLNLDKDRTYVFRVDHQRSPVPVRPTAPGAGTEEKAGNAFRRHIGNYQIGYRFTSLRGAPDGERTISVTVEVHSTETDPDERPWESGRSRGDSKLGQDPPRPLLDIPGNERTGSLGRDDGRREVFTVRTDSAGRISSIDGLEGIRAEPPFEEIAAGQVRGHIHLILGAGLHETSLERGKTYDLAAAADALLEAPFRFEGVIDRGSADVARFILLDPKGAAASDRRASGRSASCEEGNLVGEASYRTKDGLLERLSARIGPGTSAGTPRCGHPQVQVTISRVGEGAAELPRKEE